MNNLALIITDQGSVFERISDALQSGGVDVKRIKKVVGAVLLLQEDVFRYVFVTYPVADLTMDALLKALRARNCPSRHAGVVILAPPKAYGEVEKYINNSANHYLSTDFSESDMAQALKALQSVAPRASARALLKFTLDVGDKRNRVLSQTENLSSTGMRIRGPQSYPIGTRFDFELALPGKSEPVTGVAVLVRHTRWPAESIEGFGAQFLEMDADGQRQLEDFLRTADPDRGEGIG
ncbi:MAG: PilZ domain-containing protein [bacterium]|nr:PilZ domain-containing protein [bacterium]